MSIRILIILVSVYLSSCQSKTNTVNHNGPHCVKIASLPVKYAKGFSVDYYEGFKVISVRTNAYNEDSLLQYVLLPANKKAPIDFRGAVLIDTPVTKVVCVSTNHVAAISRLNLLGNLKGVTNPDLIFDTQVAKRLKSGDLISLGNSELDYEKLVTLKPDFVFTSGNWDGGDKMQMKLKTLQIKSILNLDYMEQDPLGRAEWLKFVAAFFDRESEADSIFQGIEKNYLQLKEKVSGSMAKPTVFCNLPFKEIWYMPCGENYTARLIADAGGDFLWKETTATNGLNLSLDYESVYAKAANADFWINTGIAQSLEEIKGLDKKNALFHAYQRGAVYNNNLRNTLAGGFDFWESGVVSPDIILADLISIFHPEVMPNHQLIYYQKMK